MSKVKVEKTKTHLVISIPLEDVDKDVDLSENDVLEMAEQGIEEYSKGKTETFVDFIKRKYPRYKKFLNAGS